MEKVFREFHIKKRRDRKSKPKKNLLVVICLFLSLLLSPFSSYAEWTFNKIYKFDSVPNGVSVSKDGSIGYVVTYDGMCCKFIAGKLIESFHVSGNICQDVALRSKNSDNGVWILDSGDELIEGYLSEDKLQFKTIYKFNSQPNAIALSSNGNIGFAAEEDGSIDEFVNGKFFKVIAKQDVPCTAIATTYDGTKVWFITARDELYQGIYTSQSEWKFDKIYKCTYTPTDIALSSNGSIGYIIGSSGIISYLKDGKLISTKQYKIPNGVIAIDTTADGKKLWITTGDFSLIEAVDK